MDSSAQDNKPTNSMPNFSFGQLSECSSKYLYNPELPAVTVPPAPNEHETDSNKNLSELLREVIASLKQLCSNVSELVHELRTHKEKGDF